MKLSIVVPPEVRSLGAALDWIEKAETLGFHSAMLGCGQHMDPMIVFALAAVGLPGLNGFVGEFLTMMGTANSPSGVLGWTYAVAAATGVILAAIYMLYCVGRLCFGPLKVPKYVEQEEVFEAAISKRTFHGMSRRELMTVGPLAIACVVLGLFPGIMLDPMEKVVAASTEDARQVIAERLGDVPPAVQLVETPPATSTSLELVLRGQEDER